MVLVHGMLLEVWPTKSSMVLVSQCIQLPCRNSIGTGVAKKHLKFKQGATGSSEVAFSHLSFPLLTIDDRHFPYKSPVTLVIQRYFTASVRLENVHRHQGIGLFLPCQALRLGMKPMFNWAILVGEKEPLRSVPRATTVLKDHVGHWQCCYQKIQQDRNSTAIIETVKIQALST